MACEGKARANEGLMEALEGGECRRPSAAAANENIQCNVRRRVGAYTGGCRHRLDPARCRGRPKFDEPHTVFAILQSLQTDNCRHAKLLRERRRSVDARNGFDADRERSDTVVKQGWYFWFRPPPRAVDHPDLLMRPRIWLSLTVPCTCIQPHPGCHHRLHFPL